MSSIANGAYREYNDKLVHAVKARPILYNSSLPEHKDRFLVELEWRQVAQAIGGTASQAKTRWQNLRGSFTKSLSKGRQHGGSRHGTKPRRHYLAAKMDFLRKHVAVTDVSGLTSDEEADVENPGYGADVLQTLDLVIKQDLSPPSSPDTEHVLISTIPAQPVTSYGQNQTELSNPDKTESSCEDYSPAFNGNDPPPPSTRFQAEARSPERSAIQTFFTGLMPQVDQLTERRQRKLCVEVTQLLVRMLDEQEDENRDVL